MSRWRKALILLACLAGVVGIYQWTAPEPEPKYEGRKLSDWLAPACSWQWNGGMAPGSACFEILRRQDEVSAQIGERALPHLRRWINFKPGKFRPAIRGLLPATLRTKLAARPIAGYQFGDDWFGYARETALSRTSFRALKALGPAAAPAIPDLAKAIALGHTYRGMDVMLAIGPAAVPAVTNLLATVQTNHHKAEIIRELGGFGRNGGAAVPALLAHLRHQDAEIAAESAGSLGCIGRFPESVVPALILALNRPEPLVRERAALALGDFGGAAKPALASLQNLLAGTAKEAAAATVALERISPISMAEPERQSPREVK